MTIKIIAHYDNQFIPVSGTDRYLLFKITGAAAKTQRVPLNLSLILDRSGSMSSENKLELVKQAATFVVERLSDQDRVNVIAYDEEIRVVARSTKATRTNRRDIVNSIKHLTTGGSTNLGEGWLTGCREVAEFQTEARYIDCAWLLTDGLANVGIVSQEELTAHATELRKRGISTTTFGVGLDFNEDLLRALAEKGGGNFYFIDSSHQIKNYFEGELGERLNTVARGLSLQISFPNGVKLEGLNDYEASSAANRLTLHLGDLYAGEEKLLLIKVTAPEGSLNQRLELPASLRFTNPQTGESSEMQVNSGTGLTYKDQAECAAQVVDEDFKAIIGKVLAARARQEILTANKQGDYAAVQATVASYNAAAAGAGVADTQVMQAELDDIQNLAQQAAAAPLAPGVAKAAHYSSHMTQRSRKDYKK